MRNLASEKEQSMEPVSSRRAHGRTSSLRRYDSPDEKEQSMEPVSSRRTHGRTSSLRRCESPDEKEQSMEPVSSRRTHGRTSSLRRCESPDEKEQSMEPVSSRRAHGRTSSLRRCESPDEKEQSVEPVSSRRVHESTLSKVQTKPPEVKTKPSWRSSSSSNVNEPVQFKLQLSDVLSRDIVTSSQGMESRLRVKTARQEMKETPKNPPDVKPKPWRAKLGGKELTFKDNVLTFELNTKLRARSLLEQETPTKTKERGGYGDLDTSHTRQGNLRKFADHRRSVRRRNRHRPTSNPVRQLKTRKDIRSEL